MAVHFKFASSQNLETIKIDGTHITVGDLKRVISDQKNLAKSEDSELAIVDPDTGVPFEDSVTIDRNRSVIVQRVPTGRKAKKVRLTEEFGSAETLKNGSEDIDGRSFGIMGAAGDEGEGNQDPPGSPDAPPEFQGLTEEERIQAVMNQGSSQYDPSQYVTE